MRTLRLASGRPRPLAVDVAPGIVGAYRGYAELVAALVDLPNARLGEVGRSVEGRPIHVVELGAASAPSASALLAGIHAIEWIGVEAMLALLRRLAWSPPADRRIVAFPLLNVDGYCRVEADLRSGRRRFVRGNARDVDLNRNWPAFFRPGRRRRLLGAWNAGGAAPRSEPEVAAVCGALDALASRASIDVALSLHSVGRTILYPYGGQWAAPADADRHRRVAAAIAARMPQRYWVRQVARWVPGSFAHGMEIDHLHDRYGATALLVECTFGGGSLAAPGSLVHPFRLFNPRDPERAADAIARALEPFARGVDTARVGPSAGDGPR
jgi:hypothetical protein